MKVEKLFEYIQVENYRRLSMATSSFQEYVMSWWRQRQNDVTKLDIFNWSELKETAWQISLGFLLHLEFQIEWNMEEAAEVMNVVYNSRIG